MKQNFRTSAPFLICALIPLLTKSGRNFEYEYVAMFSWLIIMLSPLWIFLDKKVVLFSNFWSTRSFFTKEIFLLLVFIPFFALVPGVVSFSLAWCQCSYGEFGFWFLVQAMPSIIIAYALAKLLVYYKNQGKSKTVILIGFSIFIAINIIDLSAHLWFHPQKRITHFLFGFIHGPVYDEWIGVDSAILLVRLYHLLIGFCLILALSLQKSRLSYFLIPSILIAALALKFSLKNSPSVNNNLEGLKKAFNHVIHEEDFSVYYMEPKENSKLQNKNFSLIKNIVIESKFHILEIKKILNLQDTPHILIFLYPDKNTKKLWFGSASTDVTDVYTPSIHISEHTWPHPSLRHELVHAVGSSFAFFGLGFHPNIALTEGLAVALAPTFRSLNLHESAASIIKNGKIENLDDIFSPFFWRIAPNRAYTIAGSLMQYLLMKFGASGIKALYGGKSFLEAFGSPFAEIISSWKQEIIANHWNSQHDLLTDALFNDPGILYDLCPHSKSILRKSHEYGWTQLRQPFNWDRKKYWQWRRSIEPKSKRLILYKLRTQAHKILSRNSKNRDPLDREDIKKLHHEVDSQIRSPYQSIEDIYLEILASDIQRHFDHKESMERLQKIQDFRNKKSIGALLARHVSLRLEIEKNLEPQQGLAWRNYLAAWTKIPKKLPHEIDLWALAYLRLRNGKTEQWQLESEILKAYHINLTEWQLPQNFSAIWYHSLAKKIFSFKRFELAAQAWEKAAKHSPSGSQAIYIEYSRLARFFHSQGKKTDKILK